MSSDTPPPSWPGPPQQPGLPARPGPAPYGGFPPGPPQRPRGRGVAVIAFVVAFVLASATSLATILVVDKIHDDRAEERSAPPEDREDDEPEEEPDGDPVDVPALDAPTEAALAAAESRPREDSVYPAVGDPGVDALHYAIDFSWFGEDDEFTATTTVTFRSTVTADQFQLDLAPHLEVESVSVDGTPTDAWEHVGKDLVVATPVTADERYEVEVAYGGPPRSVDAPTSRSDFDGVGLTRSDSADYDGWLWTMQEPYGAFTWYPVNDQPADKAIYDITVRTAPDWQGVANGTLTFSEANDVESVNRFHADEPMSSYLSTIAVGDYELTEDVSDSGVPLFYWTPAGDDAILAAIEETKDALAWVEEKLGPYPFDSLGSVVVDSESAMETQTMITYGNTDYTLSPEVIVHEIVHQWYGNKVSPNDWSDVWMNEGMAMYLQMLYEAETLEVDPDEYVGFYAADDQSYRDEAGPPAAWDADEFGQSNIYVPPGVMWHELRTQLGDEVFWEMTRAWPYVAGDAFISTGRQDYWFWLSQQAGGDLTPFLTAWLLGETSPPTTF
ncbi:MAG TPA: M1 family metallopeptidase [Nocardioides sp.]